MSIVDLSKTDPPPRTLVDVCVIGSGSGGATAARVLAEAGLQVLVLEEGADRTGPALTQRGPAMYDQLYMERGGRMTSDMSINVMQGRVLGGGGVINASDVVPIPDGVLEHWQRKYGLTDFSPSTLTPFREAALADLSANRIREDQVNRANQFLRSGTKSLGWKGELMLHNRVGCQGLGTCLIGCPINAKRNPRFVSIPAAQAAGAVFWTRARAVKIRDANAEVKRIWVRALDEKGYHERTEFSIRARTVVVAANAVATPQLLLRSGIGNEHVGRFLSLQPQLPIVARFAEEIRASDGIPQAWAVTEFEREDDPEHGLWGFRIEAVMGTPGIVSTLLPAMGHEGMKMMADYNHIAASLLLTPDDPVGSVSLSADERPVVAYELTAEHKGRLREAVKAAVRIYFAAGAHWVLVPTQPAVRFDSTADLDRVDQLDFRPASAPLISAHQQGGVRFASSPAGGAASPDGQVYGTRGVYVFDSSGYPSSASSHTMTPIITTSRYLAAKLAATLRS